MWYVIPLGHTLWDPVRFCLWPDDGPWGKNNSCHLLNHNKYSYVDGTFIYIYIWYQHKGWNPYNTLSCLDAEINPVFFTLMVPCIVFYKYTHKMSNKMQNQYLDFIARSLYMFRELSLPIITNTVTAVDSQRHMLCWVVSVMVQFV
jgi:hypothetical protein